MCVRIIATFSALFVENLRIDLIQMSLQLNDSILWVKYIVALYGRYSGSLNSIIQFDFDLLRVSRDSLVTAFIRQRLLHTISAA